MSLPNPPTATRAQPGSLVAIAIIGVCVTGYFIGLTAPMRPAVPETASERDPVANTQQTGTQQTGTQQTGGIPATSYNDMGRIRRSLAGSSAALSKLREELDPRRLLAVGSDRRSTRAFAGAPPTVPHRVDQLTSRGCLACHGQGARTRSLRIPQMSHRFYANCTQCHVEQSNGKHMLIDNRFRGAAEVKKGTRAFTGAPPTMPHSSSMRENCLSCHGRTGPDKLRTTHPQRVSCQQCHVASEALSAR